MSLVSRWPALFEALAERKRQAKILAIIVLVMALGLTGAMYAISADGGADRRVIKAFLQGGVMIVGGFGYLLWAFLHRLEKHKLIRRLAEQPENIVWIYRESRNGEMHVVAAFLDGKRINLPVGPKEDLLARVWAEVSAEAPHAEVGWSEGRNQLYMKDPAALLHRR